jgi:sterol desaturase/sphingolipid hydroxylase (fatty acid hydroxylase superfamily)
LTLESPKLLILLNGSRLAYQDLHLLPRREQENDGISGRWRKFFHNLGYGLAETLLTVFSFIALGILIEVAFRRAVSNIPSPSGWSRIFNCKCTAVLIVFQGSIEVILFMPAYWLAFKIHALSPGPLIASRPGVPFALSVVLLSSVVGDFIYYWYHRWQHTSRWLWPMHELHHEDEHVNVTTAFKFHWMDSAALHAMQVLPAIFLPMPLVTIPMLYFFRFARVTFEHLAIPLHLGPFNRLITSPATHRIHHSTLPEHFNRNFAAVWPFWDVIFGTYAAPKPGEYPPTGLISGKVSKNMKDALWGPLEVGPKPD